MACDIMEWAWTQRLKENGPFAIALALDVSAYMSDEGHEEEINLEPALPTSLKFYATRDIKKDEELLYDGYFYPTIWDEVGL